MDVDECIVVGKPGAFIDFRKGAQLAGSRRPDEVECVADKRCRIAVAFECPDPQPLAAGQSELAQFFKRPIEVEPGLFPEFAARREQRILIRLNQPLGYRPCGDVLALPERSTGMHQKDFNLPVFHAMKQDAGTDLQRERPLAGNASNALPEPFEASLPHADPRSVCAALSIQPGSVSGNSRL